LKKPSRNIDRRLPQSGKSAIAVVAALGLCFQLLVFCNVTHANTNPSQLDLDSHVNEVKDEITRFNQGLYSAQETAVLVLSKFLSSFEELWAISDLDTQKAFLELWGDVLSPDTMAQARATLIQEQSNLGGKIGANIAYSIIGNAIVDLIYEQFPASDKSSVSWKLSYQLAKSAVPAVSTAAKAAATSPTIVGALLYTADRVIAILIEMDKWNKEKNKLVDNWLIAAKFVLRSQREGLLPAAFVQNDLLTQQQIAEEMRLVYFEGTRFEMQNAWADRVSRKLTIISDVSFIKSAQISGDSSDCSLRLSILQERVNAYDTEPVSYLDSALAPVSALLGRNTKYQKFAEWVASELDLDIRACYNFEKRNVENAIAVVTDVSGSMDARVVVVDGVEYRKKIDIAKDGVRALADGLEGLGAAYSLSVFASDAKTPLDMGAGINHRATLETVLKAMQVAGATNLGAGLRAGFEQLNQGAGARCAVVMSDGQHNSGGPFDSAVVQFKANRWPVYTVGFGEEAGRDELLEIARETGGTFWQAEGRNLGSVFLDSGGLCTNTSTTKRVTETMGPGSEVEYTLTVQSGVSEIGGHATWQGSTLEVILIDPRGQKIPSSALSADDGRASTGSNYLVFSKRNPEPGTWRFKFFWSDPPPVAEQVNIALMERSDLVMTLVGIENEYPIGAPVQLVLRTGEVVGQERVPLREPRMRVRVQKPGSQVVDVIRARSRNLQLLERVVDAATVTVDLHDDGKHGDYHPGDGIFGNVFTDTHEPGVYLIRAEVSGRKSDSSWVQREIAATFQVGPLAANPVTAAAVLEAVDLLSQRQNPVRAIEAVRSGEIRSVPAPLPRPADVAPRSPIPIMQPPPQSGGTLPPQTQPRSSGGPAAAIERLRARD
jgi:hypothetical protein